MEFIIEILIELILEGSFELSKTKKTPNWLRIPLIIFIYIFFIGVLLIVLTTAMLALKENLIIGIILVVLSIALITYAISEFKHIYIKRNPESKEAKLWNKFISEIATKKLKDLNEEQKNAALCFYYDREMNIGGHVCYFDNYRKVNNEDLIHALEKVANKKYANNFKEAIENGKIDNYEKTDICYLKLYPCLTEFLEEYLINNEEKIFSEENDQEIKNKLLGK